LENYGLVIGTQSEFSKIPEELRAIAKSLFSPQKEIVFRARKSLITDTRAGPGTARSLLYQCKVCYITVDFETDASQK
jgi:hypothetical protein